MVEHLRGTRSGVRNDTYEKEWLEGLGKSAEGLGVSIEVLTRHVLAGLELGADRYGDDDFMHKDNTREALDEARDLVCYALLETQRRNLEGRDGAHYLFQAALHASVADAYLRRALRET